MATGDRNYDLDIGNLNNLDYENKNVYWGQVLVGPEDDPSGAGRCKVFVKELDRNLTGAGVFNKKSLKEPINYGDLVDKLPWSSPMLPKFFVCYPTVGETVQVFLTDRKKNRSERFYFGPLISQQQKLKDRGKLFGILDGKFGLDTGLYSFDRAWFSKNGSRLGGENSNSNWSIYADDPNEPTNVSINGRGNNDIILRNSEIYDEVLLRVAKYDRKNNSVLNLKNPGYISIVSYAGKGLGGDKEDLTTINLVGDRINLISHNGSPTKEKPNKGDGIILNSSEPNKQINLENINLHPSVYGDILWDVLKKLRIWVENHKHRGGGVAYTEPSKDVETVELLSSLDFALGPDPINKTSPNGITYKEYQGNLISNNIKIN
jgi:hypothetical protein